MRYEIATDTTTSTSRTLGAAIDHARGLDSDCTISRGDVVVASIDGGGLHLEQVLLDQIEALRAEAADAGNEEMVATCDDALDDDNDAALLRCCEAISDADAMED